MQKLSKYLKFLTLVLLFSSLWVENMVAQTYMPKNWDEDIRAIRNSSFFSTFAYKADDYAQYAPAVVMLGLKTFGYEGRTGWGQMLVSDAFSIAILTGVTKGVKYGVRRFRPDNSDHDSFPSGHTGTAFLTAAMLHKEYGWRSPWFSIGGYTVAAITGVSRIMNDKHWMSDVAAGAAIGIGSVYLGYYLSDLIFKRSQINPTYEKDTFSFDPTTKHYVAEMFFGRRFILGKGGGFGSPESVARGGVIGLSADIPLVSGAGITSRVAANSLTRSSGNTETVYSALCGGFYNFHFARRLELQAKLMAGGAWKRSIGGVDILTGGALSFMLDENFKIKIFAEYETLGTANHPWMHSVVTGWSAAWLW